MWRVWIILGLSLCACAEFPEVDAAFASADDDAAVPALLPFEELLIADAPRLDDTDDDALRARAEVLQARADRLRGPVIDTGTRDRMNAGVDRP